MFWLADQRRPGPSSWSAPRSDSKKRLEPFISRILALGHQEGLLQRQGDLRGPAIGAHSGLQAVESLLAVGVVPALQGLGADAGTLGAGSSTRVSGIPRPVPTPAPSLSRRSERPNRTETMSAASSLSPGRTRARTPRRWCRRPPFAALPPGPLNSVLGVFFRDPNSAKALPHLTGT